LRKLVADVYAVYSEGPPARCVYLFRTGDRFLRAVVALEDGDFVSTRLTPVKPPLRFRPNGELGESGWLGVGPQRVTLFS
jgi:hypothetical protein